MLVLPLIIAVASYATSPSVSGRYQAVTETEYAIELKLEPSGRAQLEFRTWEADDSTSSDTERFKGAWSLSGADVMIKLSSGQSVTFRPVACLSHQEFGQPGCSPGLKLIKTTMADRYGLQRFGLWRSDALRGQP
jgi:hypothetical protein